MTRTLRLKDLESAAANASEQPFFTTKSGNRSGFRPGPYVPQGIIFEEHFDDQPDFLGGVNGTDSAYYANEGAIIPMGWDSIRQDPKWAPSRGYPDKHESIEILASNSDKARGGVGKSFVSWRDYYDAGWNRWNSDSILSKYFPEGYPQLYVEFYIAFDPTWTPRGTSKLFRISSWSGEGSYYGFGGGGENGPVLIYDYSHSGNYGVRNRLSFRGGPHGESYGMSNHHIPGFPRDLINSGDASMSFMNNFSDLSGNLESIPYILNKLTGSGSITELGRDPQHEELYGIGGAFTKLAFFVKMNSSPGELDGEFRQWIDDEKIIDNRNVMWTKPNDLGVLPSWNRVDIGGNDFWRSDDYTNEDQREEWYSIDDIVIRDSIPEELL